MKRSQVVMFLTLLLATPSGALRAQATARSEAPNAGPSSPLSQGTTWMGVGTRIRVTTREPWPGSRPDEGFLGLWRPSSPRHQITGTLLSMDDHGLRLEVDSEPHPVLLPREAVLKWEVPRGKSRAKGALYGAGAGAFGGGVFFLLWGMGACNVPPGYSKPEGCDEFEKTQGTKAAVSVGVGIGLGALVGVMAGREQWEAVSTDRVRVTVGPTRHSGLGVAASLSF